MHNLIEGARKRSLEIIIEKKDKLDKLAETLIEKETIEKEEFDEIMGITGMEEKIEMVERKEEK
ncbi:MAG: hypothetical protein ACD_7C00518G0001 [uncultured bacterium]|nr:MAG: hypothetical protein ACD_7C00518G0001 [uncultured bacterium]